MPSDKRDSSKARRGNAASLQPSEVMRIRLKTYGFIALVVCGLVLSGCGSDQPALSSSEKANLKGGPMPQSAKEGMGKAMADAAAHPFVHKESDYTSGSSKK